MWNTSVRLTDVSNLGSCEKGDESVASDGREALGLLPDAFLEEQPLGDLRRGEVFGEHCGLLPAVEF